MLTSADDRRPASRCLMAHTSMPPCELYLVRHAIAAERGEDWPDDDKRPLTEKGIARFKEGLQGLTWLDVAIDEIFTSPLVRAKQTADLLAAGIPGKPAVKLARCAGAGAWPRRGRWRSWRGRPSAAGSRSSATSRTSASLRRTLGAGGRCRFARAASAASICRA